MFVLRNLSFTSALAFHGINRENYSEVFSLPFAGPDGIEDLFGHCFFSTIDWDKLKAKKQDPPFKPTVVSDEAFHFDSSFTSKTPKGKRKNEETLSFFSRF